MNSLLQLTNVFKHYGDIKAVDGVSFDVKRGEVFGLLGPNGAGKTSILEMIEGLRKPDSGSITIDGKDVQTALQEVKEIIGVQLQSTSLYNKIKVGEALDLYGSYYKKRLPTAKLLKLVSLEEKSNVYQTTLSGGQQQRLALALALVNDPQVVFLDEPTTGLDPQARRNLWDIIKRMTADGKTVLLTTHYMEEAEELCGRVAIMDHGKIIAQGKPSSLVENLGIDSSLVFTCDSAIDLENLQATVPGINRAQVVDNMIELFSADAQLTLTGLLSFASKMNLTLNELHVRRPNLEDVFLQLTGRSLRE
ncbi:MAG: ABC transporter ATP-binding protein [Calditrichia bacterium]